MIMFLKTPNKRLIDERSRNILLTLSNHRDKLIWVWFRYTPKGIDTVIMSSINEYLPSYWAL